MGALLVALLLALFGFFIDFLHVDTPLETLKIILPACARTDCTSSIDGRTSMSGIHKYATRTKTMLLTLSESKSESTLVSVEAEAKCLLNIFNEVFVKCANLSATFLL